VVDCSKLSGRQARRPPLARDPARACECSRVNSHKRELVQKVRPLKPLAATNPYPYRGVLLRTGLRAQPHLSFDSIESVAGLNRRQLRLASVIRPAPRRHRQPYTSKKATARTSTLLRGGVSGGQVGSSKAVWATARLVGPPDGSMP
jgi:hypothetical protein